MGPNIVVKREGPFFRKIRQFDGIEIKPIVTTDSKQSDIVLMGECIVDVDVQVNSINRVGVGDRFDFDAIKLLSIPRGGSLLILVATGFWIPPPQFQSMDPLALLVHCCRLPQYHVVPYNAMGAPPLSPTFSSRLFSFSAGRLNRE